MLSFFYICICIVIMSQPMDEEVIMLTENLVKNVSINFNTTKLILAAITWIILYI